ncbi:glycosyltransferase family 2 protein [Poseidonibacter lekithochrous]|uniref:glycosyltransferase family 2 protein n=1 Tax=Poseidonibacter lekithochrous TaxID=1904463 RepID=UPI0013DA2453|nr:glycosyltransferase family 2 protein [Poseidonibacter lekithochrous]
MNTKLPITAIVLTYNEERNLSECLESIHKYVDDIIIVDSISDDKTEEISKKYTNKFYQNKFINQSKQFIWAINNCDIKNEWILRIDADERWTKEGFFELKELMSDESIDGIYVKMKIYFMDRFIKNGAFYPNYFLRVYKKSKGTMEDRWMDEHIKVDGNVVHSNIDVIESNYDRQENISLWTNKHNGYSTREAVEFLIAKHNLYNIDSVANFWGNKTERKRWLKENLYFKVPLFLRPVMYFIYRYVFKLGFLDGKEGFIFHTLHAFWYRFLVDTKVYQIEKLANKNNQSIQEIVLEHYGINVDTSNEK